MNHVVAAITDASQVTVPIGGIIAHELADDGEDGECGEGERPTVKFQSRRHIDVVYRRLLECILVAFCLV